MQTGNNNYNNTQEAYHNNIEIVPTHDTALQHEIVDIPNYDSDVQYILVDSEKVEGRKYKKDITRQGAKWQNIMEVI